MACRTREMPFTVCPHERAGELDPRILRTLDALHLAAALTLGDDLAGLATYDERMSEACAVHGIQVLAPT